MEYKVWTHCATCQNRQDHSYDKNLGIWKCDHCGKENPAIKKLEEMQFHKNAIALANEIKAKGGTYSTPDEELYAIASTIATGSRLIEAAIEIVNEHNDEILSVE